MDDGGWTNYGIRIATNSFKLKEVELLQDVLKSKYNLETTIKKIYIKKQSVINLRNIVGPYFHSLTSTFAFSPVIKGVKVVI